MGLDQWINIDDDNKEENHEHFWYGRNEHEMHQWMQELNVHQGGDTYVPFSGIRVDLDEFDMVDLINDLSPTNETSGVFVDLDPVLRSEYRTLATNAQALLRQGTVLYYTSWW